jgi:pilus assembly protein CpaC
VTVKQLLLALVAFTIGFLPAQENLRAASDDMDIKNALQVIEQGQNLPYKNVHLPVGKARLIRLPVSVRDVLIGNPETADIVIKTPRLAYLVGRNVGSTNAFFLDVNGKEIMRLEIQVEIDVVAVRETLQQLIPNSDVKVTAVNKDLFLTGQVRSPDVSENAAQIARRFAGGEENVVNMLAVIEDQQVLLQVKIAEISRSVLKELGINLLNASALTTLTSGQFALALATAGSSTSTPFLKLAGSYTPNSTDQLNFTINALEDHGLVKTLAEPNLTTVSGVPAKFLAGGEYPIPVDGGDGAISVTYRQFGVSLNFTPVVLNSGRISLQIATEVSALSNDGAIRLASTSVPSITLRRAETTVELSSGGSLVIAGLLQSQMTTAMDGAPGLMNIPILGTFFRSNSIRQQERELIISVRCFLVKQIEPQQISDPTKGIAAPSDFELYFLGRLQNLYTETPKKVSDASLRGPLGYIVE